MLHGKNDRLKRPPILRIRHLAVMAGLVAALIAGPLGMVWKQVYITQLSMQRGAVSDSVSALRKQTAQLRLSVDKLSETSRIETMARQRLELEYPAAGKIVIVKQRGAARTAQAGGGGFITALKRSISGGRG
jgi:cell division protein FtsL